MTPFKTKTGLVAVALLTVSALGLAQIGADEGRPVTQTADGRHEARAYPDPAHGWAVPTICHGHVQGVFRGQRVSLAQCEIWLAEDASEAGAALRRHTPVRMSQRQYDALVNFVLNVGGGAYGKSQLARAINRGDCRAAAHELNAAPQRDKSGKPRIWRGAPIVEKTSGRVLLAPGETIKKWTTANGQPLPGLILRRERNRAEFEADCDLWETAA